MNDAEKKDIVSWLDDSEYLLRQAEDAKANGKYHYVVFSMQQAEEKIAKSTLACIHMINMQGKQAPILNLIDSMIGLSNKKPIDYRHDWHVAFLNKLSDIYSSPIFTVALSADESKQIKDKIDSAQKVDIKPNVTLEELDGLIKGCNMVLDMSSNTDNIFQNFNLLNGGLTVDMGQLTENISSMTMMDKSSSKNFIMQRIGISINIVVLAILDVLLSPHFDARFYPDTKAKVVLDENFPLVIRYVELCLILKRSIDMDRTYIR